MSRSTGERRTCAPGAVEEVGPAPAQPVRYLQVPVVDPAAQRRATGGRLLRPVLAEAARTGTSAYLETADPRNVGCCEAAVASPRRMRRCTPADRR